MKTIHKFPFLIGDEIRIAMPERHRVLLVELQSGSPCLWAIVNTEDRVEPGGVRFRIFGTGHPLPERSLAHVATFQSGPFVWHMFYDAPCRPAEPS